MWPFNRKLKSLFGKTKRIKIYGVPFTIRKIDCFDYLDGSKVMLQLYDIYKIGNSKPELIQNRFKKVKPHFRDVFMSGVIEPKLVRKKEEDGLFVDNLFTELDLANQLYSAIINFTYQKKKLKSKAYLGLG